MPLSSHWLQKACIIPLAQTVSKAPVIPLADKRLYFVSSGSAEKNFYNLIGSMIPTVRLFHLIGGDNEPANLVG